MRKRIFAGVLAVALAMTVTACGTQEPSDSRIPDCCEGDSISAIIAAERTATDVPDCCEGTVISTAESTVTVPADCCGS